MFIKNGLVKKKPYKKFSKQSGVQDVRSWFKAFLIDLDKYITEIKKDTNKPKRKQAGLNNSGSDPVEYFLK